MHQTMWGTLGQTELPRSLAGSKVCPRGPALSPQLSSTQLEGSTIPSAKTEALRMSAAAIPAAPLSKVLPSLET